MKIAFLAVLLLGDALVAWAQPVSVGDRVRAYRPGRAVMLGQVVAAADSEFMVQSAIHGSVPIRFAELYRLDRSEGIHDHTALGAAIGAGGGIAFTIFVLTQFCDSFDSPCQGDEYVKAAAIFAIPPTLAGALIGALVRTERWRPVKLRRMSVAVGPTVEGIGIRLGLRF